MSISRSNPDSDPALSRDGRAPLGHLGRRLLVPAVLAIAAFLLLALVADAGELLERLGEFDPRLLVPVLGLSLVNYGLRFVRWQVYLKALDVRLPLASSLAIFLVGFVLSVTPGKAGELGKAWLARELGGGAARRTVAAVLTERVTDVLGTALLVALGALAIPGARGPALAGLALIGLAIGILVWPPVAHRALTLAERLPWVGPRLEIVEEVWDRLRALLSPSLLAFGVSAAMLAWGAEGLGFYLVARLYGAEGSPPMAIFGYAASTLVGALSMLPGGLLVTEGSLAALLGLQGLDAAAAASATLWTRAATLWFAVLLGLLAVPYVVRRLRARPDGGRRSD